MKSLPTIKKIKSVAQIVSELAVETNDINNIINTLATNDSGVHIGRFVFIKEKIEKDIEKSIIDIITDIVQNEMIYDKQRIQLEVANWFEKRSIANIKLMRTGQEKHLKINNFPGEDGIGYYLNAYGKKFILRLNLNNNIVSLYREE